MPEVDTFAVLLTTKQAAAYLNLQPRTLDDWRLRKIGPAYIKLINDAVRYRQSVLDAWLEAQTVTHAA